MRPLRDDAAIDMTIQETDIAIIGAGPVGLFAVFQCGMLRMKCHVIDALSELGGQCAALYPEKPIYDVPGFPAVEALDLVRHLAEQAGPFNPQYHLGEQTTGLTRLEDGRFRVETARGTVVVARAVIIAAGAGAFGPNRPPLDGIEDFEGKSVFYLVSRREAFRDQRIVIAGGGDSAVDWALSLAPVAAKVMVVHRRPKFRAAPESAARLQQLVAEGAIELVTPYQLHALRGEAGKLEQVVVRDLDGVERVLGADILLPFFGLSTELGPIADWGLNLERNQIPIEPTTGATAVPGIFAIGDVASYPHKLKLILTGFAEAAQAAHAAFAFVHPGEALHFEHSTTRGVPV